MMSLDEENRSIAHIEACRRINRRVADRCAEHGVTAEDAAIAAVYSAHDLALRMGLDASEAIEWLRTALDLQERQLLNTVASRH